MFVSIHVQGMNCVPEFRLTCPNASREVALDPCLHRTFSRTRELQVHMAGLLGEDTYSREGGLTCDCGAVRCRGRFP